MALARSTRFANTVVSIRLSAGAVALAFLVFQPLRLQVMLDLDLAVQPTVFKGLEVARGPGNLGSRVGREAWVPGERTEPGRRKEWSDKAPREGAGLLPHWVPKNSSHSKCFLCARNCPKCFTSFGSFLPPRKPQSGSGTWYNNVRRCRDVQAQGHTAGQGVTGLGHPPASGQAPVRCTAQVSALGGIL